MVQILSKRFETVVGTEPPFHGATHFEEVAVVVHHEQNHQVHLPLGEPPAVDDGAGEGPLHRHPVLRLRGNPTAIDVKEEKKKNERESRAEPKTSALTSLCSLTS